MHILYESFFWVERVKVIMKSGKLYYSTKNQVVKVDLFLTSFFFIKVQLLMEPDQSTHKENTICFFVLLMKDQVYT